MGMQTVIIIINSAGIPMIWMKRLSFVTFCRKLRNPELKKTLYDLFDIETMLDKHIILLSSGELRKFQLTKTLLSNPRVLIMDNPFIGLDAKTRDQLHALLCELIRMTCLQIILVLSKTDDIPSLITHVIPVENRMCGE